MSCTVIPEMTRKSHQVWRMGKDWTSSKTNFLSLGMLGPLPSFSVHVITVLMGRGSVPQMWPHYRQGHRVEQEGSRLSKQGTGLMFQSHH